jgi:Holliday junction resolvase RusA-like endonuclease
MTAPANNGRETVITFVAEGEPKGQPRPRAFSRGGHARVYDPATAEGWKSQIALAARDHRPPKPLRGAIRLSIDFIFPRPRAHYRTGRFADQLRPSAPTRHTTKPDLDNCIKAVKDALTAIGMWADDCAVCEYGPMVKRYEQPGGARPGALIRIVVLDTSAPGGGKE